MFDNIVSVSSIRVGDLDVILEYSAKNLDSWFDSHIDHTDKGTTCGSAFFCLYIEIRIMRRYLY